MAKKRGKQRTEFRKRYQGRSRRGDFTREFRSGDDDGLADAVHGERLTGKGELTRKRTVQDQSDELDGDLLPGRVVSAHGLKCKVVDDRDGRVFECAIRQVLKSLSIDGRSPVVAGDRVHFRASSELDGMIEHVEPRRGVISRTSRGQQHVLVANVDYLMIIASASHPGIKPALIDRFLLTAVQYGLEPVVVINKVDLVETGPLQPLIGVYASLGFRVLMTSATEGIGIPYLRHLIAGKQTALAGQSGVGKSSLLNAIEPGLGLAVGHVSEDNDKGRHTTTAARLIPTADGGAVFDTPGIRQFQLWDISPEEVGGLMPDFRAYVSGCRYPNCLHLSEDGCAVKDAVADGRIDARRYDAYCHLLEDDLLADA